MHNWRIYGHGRPYSMLLFGTRLASRVRVMVGIRVRVTARCFVVTGRHTWMLHSSVAEGGGRVFLSVRGGLLPTNSHSIFYSRVSKIGIFRHCQP